MNKEVIIEWIWWILAATFFILELLVSGIFFIWLGMSAAIVALVELVFPNISWASELLLFSGLVVITLYITRKYFFNNDAIKVNDPSKRNTNLIGGEYIINYPIVDGVGKIIIDDTMWKVKGDDCPSGTKVIITDIDGSILIVKPK